MSSDQSMQSKSGAALPAEQRNILETLEADWRRMAGNQFTLESGRLNPAEMHEALPHTFLLNRTGPGLARIRVAGQRLHDLLGMDPRGMSLGVFFDDDSRPEIAEMMETAVSLPAILSVPLIAKRSFGRAAPAEILMLPMRDSDGDVTRVLGAIVTSYKWNGRVARLSIDREQELRCERLVGAFPDRRRNRRDAPQTREDQIAVMQKTLHSDAPTQTEPLPRQAQPIHRPAPRPALRLVVDNT